MTSVTILTFRLKIFLGPRSSLKKNITPDPDSNCLTMYCIQERFFKKVDFEKKEDSLRISVIIDCYCEMLR